MSSSVLKCSALSHFRSLSAVIGYPFSWRIDRFYGALYPLRYIAVHAAKR